VVPVAVADDDVDEPAVPCFSTDVPLALFSVVLYFVPAGSFIPAALLDSVLLADEPP